MRITKEIVKKYAEGYDEHHSKKNPDDKVIESEIKKWFETHRYLDKKRFIKTAEWKSKRPKKHYKNNDDLTVREITEFSLSAKSEQARIKSLFVLDGVSYPIASAILHFAFPDKYPILDFRVLESLENLGSKIKKPKTYTFTFWKEYCEEILDIAKKVGEDIRTVDKALWMYSKNQKKGKKKRGKT